MKPLRMNVPLPARRFRVSGAPRPTLRRHGLTTASALLALIVASAAPGGRANAGGIVATAPQEEPQVSVVPWEFRVSYVNGYKLMEPLWDPARHQWEFGIGDLDVTPPGWPLSLTLQLLLSYSPAVPGIPRVRGEYSGAYEFTFGLRKYFNLDSDLQPHLSAGAGFLGASTTTSLENWWSVQEANQSSFGLWAAGGVLWFFSESNFTGVTLRWSSGVINLFQNEVDAGGGHLLFHIGWRW